MNGTLWTISPLMKWTSRDSRSNVADDDRVVRPPRGGQCGGEHGSPLQRVGTLARLHFYVLVADQLVALAFGEPLGRLALRLEPQPAPALALGADAVVGEGGRPRRP